MINVFGLISKEEMTEEQFHGGSTLTGLSKAEREQYEKHTIIIVYWRKMEAKARRKSLAAQARRKATRKRYDNGGTTVNLSCIITTLFYV